MPPEDYDRRISRLEGKLDDLFEALISLARTEEQVKTLFNQHKWLSEEEVKLEEELDKLKETNDKIVASNKTLVKVTLGIGIALAVEAMMLAVTFSANGGFL